MDPNYTEAQGAVRKRHGRNEIMSRAQNISITPSPIETM